MWHKEPKLWAKAALQVREELVWEQNACTHRLRPRLKPGIISKKYVSFINL